MAPPINPTFHAEHGDNIELSTEDRVATRLRGFDRGLCALGAPFYISNEPRAPAAAAGDQPAVNVSLLVTRTDRRFNGSLGLGVSPQAPSRARLPASSRSAESGWAFAQVPQSALTVNTLLTVWLDRRTRTLCYAATRSRDREVLEAGGDAVAAKGEVLLDDPAILDCLDAKQPLWFYVDVYGFVQQVQILGENGSGALVIPPNLSMVNESYKEGDFQPDAYTDASAHPPGDDQFVLECARGASRSQEMVLTPRVVQRMQELVAERRTRQPVEEEEHLELTRVAALRIEGVDIRVSRGDIVDEDTEAYLNPTSTIFKLGGQVSQAILARGGDSIKQECRAKGLMENSVFVSGAGELENYGVKCIVHVRSPKSGQDCEKVIRAGLEAAKQKGVKSIAIPMIGAGNQRKDPVEMVRSIVKACIEFSLTQSPRKIIDIELVSYDEESYATFLVELTDAARTLPAGCAKRELYEKIELTPATDEYKTAERYVLNGKVPHLELAQVFKIRAPHLETKYICHRDQLMNQYFEHQKILENLELDVFHGTQEQITTKILARGFDPKFGSQDLRRAKFGQGCYFARNIEYSAEDRFSVPNGPEKLKFVFVTRLLVGATFPAKDHHMPNAGKVLTKPPDNPDTGFSFDTAVNKVQDPKVFVSFHTDQALPLYLLVLRNKTQV